MKCPKCGFEQIEESPDECAKCGILFEKWLDKLERDEASAQPTLDPVEQLGAPARIWVHPPASVIWGTRLCQLGVLMVTLSILSFLINLIGFEFILLMPLETFDNPTHAKFWTMGTGVVVAIIGAAMGGEMPDPD